MLTKIEEDLISKGYKFKKEFIGSPCSAYNFANNERKKGNLARVLKLRGVTLTVYVKEKCK
jgi:hypothetical protein